MDETQLSDAERRFLGQLRTLPTSIRSRLLGWALELLPSIGFFLYGLFTERRFFLILGFLSLLYFSLWRMYGQFRGFRVMHGIYEKVLAPEPSGTDGERP